MIKGFATSSCAATSSTSRSPSSSARRSAPWSTRSRTTSSAGSWAAIGGSPDFGRAGVTVSGSKIVYGTTITALIQFLIVAAAIYFVIVGPMAHLSERYGKTADAETPARA
jgi:hypothetical protein